MAKTFEQQFRDLLGDQGQGLKAGQLPTIFPGPTTSFGKCDITPFLTQNILKNGGEIIMSFEMEPGQLTNKISKACQSR